MTDRTMSDDSEAIEDAPRRPRFATPGMAAAVGCALACAALVTTLLTARGTTGEVLGQGLTPFVAGAIVALLAGLIRRKVDSVLWAYAATTVLLGVPGIVRAVLGSRVPAERPPATAELDDRENDAQLQAEIDADLKAVFATAPPDGAPDVAFERRKLDALKRAAARSVGSSARFYSIFASTQEENWMLTKDLVAAKGALPELDLERAQDRDDLVRQLAAWRRLRNAIDAIVALAKTEPDRLERVLRERRAHEALSRGALKTFRPGMRRAAAGWQREATRVDATVRVFELLQRRAGQWRARANEVTFVDDADRTAFDGLVRKINDGDAAPRLFGPEENPRLTVDPPAP